MAAARPLSGWGRHPWRPERRPGCRQTEVPSPRLWPAQEVRSILKSTELTSGGSGKAERPTLTKMGGVPSAPAAYASGRTPLANPSGPGERDGRRTRKHGGFVGQFAKPTGRPTRAGSKPWKLAPALRSRMDEFAGGSHLPRPSSQTS